MKGSKRIKISDKMMDKVCLYFHWVYVLMAIILLGLFCYHTYQYFQEPNFYYDEWITYPNGDWIVAYCGSETTIWDDIIQCGWWMPICFVMRLVGSFGRWRLDFMVGSIIMWGYCVWWLNNRGIPIRTKEV